MRLPPIAFCVAVLAVVPLALAATHPRQAEVEAIAELDPVRYAGTWYEIARFPNRFQDDCAGEVTATYRLRDDGRIDVVNACNEADGSRKSAEGIAKKASDDGPYSKLKVRFAPGFLSWLPFVWGDYWVLALDDDYTRVAVGSPSREYLWILSRTPELAESEYQALVDRVAAMGFPVARLERTRQNHEGP
jgi:apolipoprotein D and lipocalin family protein